MTAIATPRVRLPIPAHTHLHNVADGIIVAAPCGQQRVRDSHRHHGVVSKEAFLSEQGEVLCLNIVELIDRADDISNDCTFHARFLSFIMIIRHWERDAVRQSGALHQGTHLRILSANAK